MMSENTRVEIRNDYNRGPSTELEQATDFYIRFIKFIDEGDRVVCCIMCESDFPIVTTSPVLEHQSPSDAMRVAEREARMQLKEHLDFLGAHKRMLGGR